MRRKINDMGHNKRKIPNKTRITTAYPAGNLSLNISPATYGAVIDPKATKYSGKPGMVTKMIESINFAIAISEIIIL